MKSRTHKTLGVNESKLYDAAKRDRRSLDPQALLSPEAMRAFIDSCMCPYCDRGPFKVLAVHTNKAHGIDRRELRAQAGLTLNEPVASAEFRKRARELAFERDIGHSEAARVALRNAKRRQMTDAGKAKVARVTAERMAAIPLHVKQGMARRASLSVTPEGRLRRAEALRLRNSQPDQRERFVANTQTPEAQARRNKAVAETRKGRLQPCGTVAAYKRGCRCELCSDAKRRSRPATGGIRRGEGHYKSVLSNDQVGELRRLRESGWTLQNLAARFGVSESTVSLIARGKSRN